MNIKAFPEPARLPVIKALPDALTFRDGKKVTTAAQWDKRRNELKDLFQHYEYGHLPQAPKNLKAVETLNETLKGTKTAVKRVQLRFGPKHGATLDVLFYIPKNRKGPFPVILDGDMSFNASYAHNAHEYVKRGYVIATFHRVQLDADDHSRYDGVRCLYPKYDWGTLAAWAWSYHRVVDYLQTATWCDTDKIAVTGHSRGGKTVLLAAALDERIALTCPNASGTCGVGPLRLRYTGEAIDDITKMFPYWFNERFQGFRGKNVNRFPVDQHELIALVAPRAFLTTIATGDTWCNPQGCQAAYLEARKVFEFLGAEGRIGIHYREGDHLHGKADWDALVDFCDMVFFGKKVKRRFDMLPYNPDALPFV